MRKSISVRLICLAMLGTISSCSASLEQSVEQIGSLLVDGKQIIIVDAVPLDESTALLLALDGRVIKAGKQSQGLKDLVVVEAITYTSSIDISPDGNLFLVENGQSLMVFQLVDGRKLGEFVFDDAQSSPYWISNTSIVYTTSQSDCSVGLLDLDGPSRKSVLEMDGLCRLVGVDASKSRLFLKRHDRGFPLADFGYAEFGQGRVAKYVLLHESRLRSPEGQFAFLEERTCIVFSALDGEIGTHAVYVARPGQEEIRVSSGRIDSTENMHWNSALTHFALLAQPNSRPEEAMAGSANLTIRWRPDIRIASSADLCGRLATP